ncbi:MAG: hypothetical protein E6G45_02285 [Actinobacteria bacterium]|nr:MAG: hypothetical protein E6G45_02285 [Actinomycetota bacterium]
MRALLGVSIALFVTTSAAAAPPRAGLVVPGKSLGGLRLGATRAQVRAAWGPRFGLCRDCREQTWYFNYRPFEPQGAGVSFRKGRAAALFTLWSPQGWRTERGLAIGDTAVRVAGLYGTLLSVNCGRYSASTIRRGRTTTAIYVVDEQVWGFGLLAPGEAVCR